jgi:hypothetical protein
MPLKEKPGDKKYQQNHLTIGVDRKHNNLPALQTLLAGTVPKAKSIFKITESQNG